jgi:tetratricopeptide (TPR) repeat protein
MVQKTKLRNTRQLIVNKAIDLVYQNKLSTALLLIKKNFKAEDAITLFFKGWTHQINNEHEKAIKFFEKSLTKNPINQDALIGLASSYLEIGDFNRALECAEQCVLIKANDPRTMLTLATVISKKHRGDVENQLKAIQFYSQAFSLMQTPAIQTAERTKLLVDILAGWGASLLDIHQPEEAILVLELAVEIDNLNPLVHKNLASAYASLNEIDKAIDSCKKAQMSDDAAIVHDSMYQEGMLELMKGNYSKGWRLHEFRLNTSQFSSIRSLEVPQWDGRPLQEYESLLIYQEQGIGDTLQFSRYIPLALSRVKNLDIEVMPNHYQQWLDPSSEPASIRAFLHNNFKQLRNSFVKGWNSPDYTEYTYITSFMSLPRLFRTTLSNIPEIPNFKSVENSINCAKYDIGILWQGSKAHRNDGNRSIPTSAIEQLVAKHSDKSFVSLQLEHYAELDHLPNLKQLDAHIKNIDDTLHIINNCSLVVTVDSMVAHLAGSVNKPTLILHAYSPDWRWMLERRDSPWYPSIVNIRQSERKNWNSVMTELNEQLNKLFEIEIKLD